MDLQFTPEGAFRHFLENYKGKKDRDIYEAKYTLDNGRPYPLGVRRIRRILEKHAPGKYEFQEVVTFHE